MPNAPQPPSDFDAVMRRTWAYTLKALREQGTWQDSDRHVLERYVRALARATAARAITDAEGLTTTGGRGQPVAHPAVRIGRDAERDAGDYARDLLLTPRARRLAGLVETSAMDDELAELLER